MRNFSATAEPTGRKSRVKGNSFVVQKHAARRLHYDFRLEMEGVLRSWAVTRGPSLVAGDKRLAVHVEDHPLEYGQFEGTIPKGEYGGGAVIIWDRGTWSPIGDARKGYSKGHLDFELQGEKLNGRWHLVRMKAKAREKHENWLLIKGDDEFARSEDAPAILKERPESVDSGRRVEEVAGEEPGWSSKTGKIPKTRAKANVARETKNDSSPPINPASANGALKASLPQFLDPMLSTLVAKPPKGTRWVHEIKFDGYRLQARIEAGRVKLLTRSGLDWTKRFGKGIISALQELPAGTALIDGEVVVERESGASDFSALQYDLSEGKSDRFVFYAFDLMYLDGYNLARAPLLERKAQLERLLSAAGPVIRYSSHFEESGDLVLQQACRLSLEGVVSKQVDGIYTSGRVKTWVKSKCSARQEFVVAGYVPSTVSRKAIGSLVLGTYEGKALIHVGRVGTGFRASVAEDLFKRLERIRATSSPFSQKLSAEQSSQVKYTRPEMVVEVEFRAWTADGSLRHASFRGVREDRKASEVTRESLKSSSAATSRRRVKLTHPDRLYWPEDGVTKEGLADYYAEVWSHIAPFIVGRPLALLRCPSGIEGETFFQKHAWTGLNPHVALVEDPKSPSDPPLISINDFDGLAALVQAAALEIHPWGSTVRDWERPDTITMDLDPGEAVTWEAVIAAAEDVRERLNKHGLSAFVKTSGGKGLHVVAPVRPKADWSNVKAFTKGIAEEMAADSPSRYVATITKSKRHGKILIDYLRNQRGATAVAALSTRARPGAAVSMPLSWDELNPAIGPDYFTIKNAGTRLASLKIDPWADFFSSAAPIKIGRKRNSRS